MASTWWNEAGCIASTFVAVATMVVSTVVYSRQDKDTIAPSSFSSPSPPHSPSPSPSLRPPSASFRATILTPRSSSPYFSNAWLQNFGLVASTVLAIASLAMAVAEYANNGEDTILVSSPYSATPSPSTPDPSTPSPSRHPSSPPPSIFFPFPSSGDPPAAPTVATDHPAAPTESFPAPAAPTIGTNHPAAPTGSTDSSAAPTVAFFPAPAASSAPVVTSSTGPVISTPSPASIRTYLLTPSPSSSQFSSSSYFFPPNFTSSYSSSSSSSYSASTRPKPPSSSPPSSASSSSSIRPYTPAPSLSTSSPASSNTDKDPGNGLQRLPEEGFDWLALGFLSASVFFFVLSVLLWRLKGRPSPRRRERSSEV